MNLHSRRKFLNNIWNGCVGMGMTSVLPSCARENVDVKSDLPIFDDVDICVLGGSCTGVFAAVRAARLGATVAVVEKQNAFGGVATNSLVNVWHSLYDVGKTQRIIAGLTQEVIDRLSEREAVERNPNPSSAYRLN